MKTKAPTPMTATAVFDALQDAPLTLDGLPARATSISEGKFIVITTSKPVIGTLYASGEWHFLSAHSVLVNKKGAFKS